MTENHNRMPGHSLEWVGAPHDDLGRRITKFGGRVDGPGRARCSCGALSEALPSAYRRKPWHRAHKDALRHEALR